MKFLKGKLTLAESIAWLIFVLSTAAMIFKSIWLNDIVTPTEWLWKLSGMGDSVLTSLIAGSVFHLVVSALFERAEMAKVRPGLRLKFRRLAGQYEGMVRDLAVGANIVGAQDVYELDLAHILTTLNPNAPSAILVGMADSHLTWVGAMQHWTIRGSNILEKIERRVRFLDAETISLLDQIQDASFPSQLDIAARMPMNNENMGFMLSTLTRYRDLMLLVRDRAERL